ncbi:hypothetical protein FD12_GL000439 [Lentilactobacillus rapi DSM 19907 = JCM 15042]|uniref:Uncharacterized protein n=2 Tax=Lentilactobacillus rapi TaxID=481723 RepID=A0A512PJK8_9LACO|nr:hypothetical protein [Lentilactobacillus rapi]KRL15967.1 hypothetical protein FD12_GL000439 [Lentilactobacillus rapi DSM 19907 = JCM 15042]GEP71363.1 hypothetical protein LRA02_02310 [Lentilactobacillus rapi]
MNVRDKIQVIIDSGDSAYQIQQLTGVNSSVIIRLRNNNRSIDNLSLKTVEKLEQYYDYHLSAKHPAPKDVHLSHFRHRLINVLQELYEFQQEKVEQVAAPDDEQAMAAVIEQLFNDVLADQLEIEKMKQIYNQKLTKKPTV